MANPWDVGSAKVLASLGFPALATTSSGHAATLGRRDQSVTREEMLDHVTEITAAIDVPLNVDSERCFGDTPSDVAATVREIAERGAAGFSIEDFNPATGQADPIDIVAERVAAAAEATHATASPMVLTARAESHLYGEGVLDDTIARLSAFRDAGADVVYAPGLTELDDIKRIIDEVGAPVNVLAWPKAPTVAELASIGVRRVSTGGALAFAALGTLADAGRELLEQGTYDYFDRALRPDDRRSLK
jgi:2-methylisocitrate lyase-like PEP mutase family enzyme